MTTHQLSVQLRPGPECTDRELFLALRGATGTQRDRIQEILVQRHTGLVRWLVKRYANPAIERDELMQVGFTGLVLAVQRFDPEHGPDFVSFARPTIQGEIRRWFRDKRRVIRLPRRLQETKAALRQATEQLTHDLQRAPTIVELATHLALAEELVLEAMSADDNFNPQSLDCHIGSDDENSWTLSDTVGSLDPGIDHVVNVAALRPLLATVASREKQILQLSFYEDLTQVEIARRLGLSQVDVSRLIKRTLRELAQQLMAD
jgi:RNA polymerase sigma-B factor